MVGIAVIGLGRMGKLYVDIVRRFIDGAELIGVWTRTVAKARAIASSLGVKAYESLDAVGRDPRVDAVIIATPTYTHADMIKFFAEYNKHVFVEKPIDVDLSKAEEAIKYCESRGVTLLVGYMRRFDEPYVRAKEIIDKGGIGRPLIYIGISKDPEPPPEGWLRDPKLSGGLVLDLMSHDFDLACWYLGSDVCEVYAYGDAYIFNYMKDVGDYDNVVAYLRMCNGSIAIVYGSRKSGYGYDIRCEIHGTEGKLSIGLEYEPSIRLSKGQGLIANSVSWFQKRFFNAYIEEVRHFVNVIKDKEELRIKPQEALRTLRIALAVSKSLKEGKVVKIA